MSTTKKKRHGDEFVAVQILQSFVSSRRRRHHHFLPPLAAVSGCFLLLLLLLLALLLFLCPPINTSLNNGANVEKDGIFRVPMSGGSLGQNLWTSNQYNSFYGCSNASHGFLASFNEKNRMKAADTKNEPNRYLLIATSGGLNQQRTGVQAVELTKFDYRLSNRLDSDLQKLRCRVNYHALRFTDPIHEMGIKLVERMRAKSKHYVALHLRFEPDMLAFSGCYYGGGHKETKELGAIRKRWKTLHVSRVESSRPSYTYIIILTMKNPQKERRQGKCPLTPEEVGLMLRALGFGNDVHIYVASGQVYGGEDTLAPLKALFPNLHTKETIASKEEIAPFSSFSSRMAALDFIVCDESDVFVANNNGNMAKILAGKRRYFGHKPTIRPNAKKLYRVFQDRDKMKWEEFASVVRKFQVGFMGQPNEVRLGRGEFHQHPLSCICEKSHLFQNRGKIDGEKSSNNDMNDEGLSEDEQDWAETGYYGEDENNGGRKYSDFAQMNSEQPEIEEMISDR
ncbi:O-fucosyltransferase family protein [Striga asiatica]|uniref:O-fucosyltransferase family protein n=1 Tax=Striga asiatica TaxID=4170 RepID=A0A5A7R1H0_STRAF|nr:O-fucosyltransferase family protein [Striga asiatica]